MMEDTIVKQQQQRNETAQPLKNRQRVFVVPFDDKGIFLFRTDGDLKRLVGEVQERDPSILFTIARIVIEESYQLFPKCIAEDLHDRKGTHGISLFYYNPLVHDVLEQLLTDPKNLIFYPDSDNTCGISLSAMEEKPPITVAFRIVNSDKLDISSLNKQFLERLGKKIGKNIKIGKIDPEQLDEDSCIVCGYVKNKQQSLSKESFIEDKAIYIVGGDKNEYWSLMQEAMIIG